MTGLPPAGRLEPRREQVRAERWRKTGAIHPRCRASCHPPARRLLDAIAGRLGVDAGWLTAGDGQPFPDDRTDVDRGIPVARVALPGPPLRHQHLIVERATHPSVVPSSTAYWLELRPDHPLVRGRKCRAGDRLLMATDPAEFPPEARLSDHLCVVPVGAGGTRLEVATVRYVPADHKSGDAHLEAEFPTPTRAGPSSVERVYRHLPGGEVRYSERPLVLAADRTAVRLPVAVRYDAVAAVWSHLLYRPPA